MKRSYDCIVIGAGVAGMTAAIYLKRSNLNVLLIDKSTPGGQLLKIKSIFNYPGFKEINGADLALNMYEQVNELNIDYSMDYVTEIIDNKITKTIKTFNKKEYDCKYVILATGKLPRKLNVEGEKKYNLKGVSYCAICDGVLYHNKVVALIGNGDYTLEECLYLSSICKKVHLVVKDDELSSSKDLINQVKNTPNVNIMYNSYVSKIIGDENKITSVIVNNDKIEIDGVFINIGSTPNIDFINNLKINNENGFIIVDHEMKTSINGIYACGDSIKKDYYQIVTAASEGAIAALNIKKDINKK